MPNSSDEDSGQNRASRGLPFDLTNIENELFKLAPKSREHPDERDARLRREQYDAEHRRRGEMAILCAVLTSVGVVSVICLGIVLVPSSAPESVTWATTLLTTIVSGGLGYMTGKNSKSTT